MSRASRHFADLTPLRTSPAYRSLWSAILFANIGQGMTSVAVGIQVYRMTNSSFAVGLIGFFQFLPLVVSGLFGGSWSDRADRRKVAIWSWSGLMACSAVLAATSWFGVINLGLLYAVVALQTVSFGIGAPARQSAIPRLLPASQLAAANALSGFSWNLGAALGPMLGGFIIGATDQVAVAYAFDAVLFIVTLSLVQKLPPLPPTGESIGGHWSSVKEGFNFLRHRRHIRMNLYIDIVAMVFGLPRALFPAIAAGWYPGDSGGAAMAVGMLSAAITLGGVISSALSGQLTRLHRHGAVVILSVFAWGGTIAAFGLAPNLWWGVLALTAAGAADNVSAIFRNTIMQASVPDEFRGRLQGFYTVVVAGGPRVGDLEAGTVAAWRGEAFSVVSGGLLCILGAVALTWRYRDYWRYDSRDPLK